MQSRGTVDIPPISYRVPPIQLNRKLRGISQDIPFVRINTTNILRKWQGDYMQTKKTFVPKSCLGADGLNLSNLKNRGMYFLVAVGRRKCGRPMVVAAKEASAVLADNTSNLLYYKRLI